MSSKNLDNAKKAKQDEFYTQLTDIEKELKHYKHHFKDKVVYCNCDDPTENNFFHYFAYNFEYLGLKKLITTCYKNPNDPNSKALLLEYNGDLNGDKIPNPEEIGIKELKGDGDFRSEESLEILKQADIVVTNPPFSLFREFVAQLVEYDKKFLIIGNQNAITYKETFKLIKDNKLWLGCTNPKDFIVPEYYGDKDSTWIDDNGVKHQKFGNISWFTNLEIKKRHEDLILYKKYIPEEYPKYDNYDAINVDKTKDIPMDYSGAMGVPITFLDKYSPEQFEIISLGIVGSIEFTCNKKMEILDKHGNPTGKYTFNAKGTLYKLYNPKIDKKPAFKDAETGDLYSSIYARVIIKNKRLQS